MVDKAGEVKANDSDRWESEIIDSLDEAAEQDSETVEITNDLLRALRRKKGFGLFFVQCNPAQGQRIIEAASKRFPEKQIEKVELFEQSETLYGELAERYENEAFEIACVTGVEQALYKYEDTKRLGGWSWEEVYSYSWKGVPPLLSHLNRQREAFEANLPIALIFFVPSFVIDYFVQRAPDFFDWRSGFFKLSESSENLKKASQELIGNSYREYHSLTSDQRMGKILEIKDKVLQLEQSDCEQSSNLLREQGRLFEIEGEQMKALECYNRAVKLFPGNYSVLNSKGILLRKLNRYMEAVAQYETAIEVKPDYHTAWYNKGNVLMALNRYDDSIQSYDRALAINPNYTSAWERRGNVLYKLERYKEALESYDRALEINPNYSHGWGIRGNILRRLERYKEALESYDRALEINPNYSHGWGIRGNILRRLERYEEALESCDRALEINPNYSHGWGIRGNVLRRLERYEEAIESYDHALKEIPNLYPAWIDKGIAFYELSRFKESYRCFEEAGRINPASGDCLNNQGYLLLVQCSYGLQPVFGKPLLIRHSQYPEVANDTTIDSCQFRKSLNILNEAVTLNPQFALAWANQSFPAYYLGDYQGALKNCNKALDLDPENEEKMNEVVYTNRGYIHLKLGNFSEALQSFSTALSIDPELAEAWIGKGTVLCTLNRYSEAFDSFTQAHNLNHPLAQRSLEFAQQHLSQSA